MIKSYILPYIKSWVFQKMEAYIVIRLEVLVNKYPFLKVLYSLFYIFSILNSGIFILLNRFKNKNTIKNRIIFYIVNT